MAIKRLKSRNAGQDFESGMRSDRALKALLAVTFDLENRLRALEGRPAVSEEHARAILKARFTQ